MNKFFTVFIFTIACLSAGAQVVNGVPNQILSGPGNQREYDLFGDSTVFCAGAYAQNTAITAGTGCWNSILASETGASLFNAGEASWFGEDITNAILTYYAQPLTATSLGINQKILFDQSGINNAAQCNSGAGGTDCINNVIGTRTFNQAWLELPQSNWVMASAMTPTGTWTADTTVPINAATTGTAMKSTTSGGTLSYTIPSGFGGGVYSCWLARNSNAGTFTETIGGSSIAAFNTASNTFHNYGSGSTALNFFSATVAAFCQFNAITASTGATSVVVTGTSATGAGNIVSFLGLAFIPASGTVGSTDMEIDVSRVALDSNGTVTAAFSSAVDTITAQSLTNGLNVVGVSLRNSVTAAGVTSPGLNTTTDMIGGGTALSVACNPADASGNLHPSCTGHLDEAITIAATAIQAGKGFAPIPQGQAPQTVIQTLKVGPGITDFNYIGPGHAPFYSTTTPIASCWEDGTGSFTIGPLCVGKFYDGTNYKLGLITNKGIAQTNCPNSYAQPGGSDAGCGTPVMNTDALGNLQALKFLTNTNCSSAASPAVCGSAPSGSILIPTGTTSSTLTVNTTAVTANSQIFFYPDDTLGTKLGVTCNSTLATLVGGSAITARTAGTSFQITFNGTIATNGVCGSYNIVN